MPLARKRATAMLEELWHLWQDTLRPQLVGERIHIVDAADYGIPYVNSPLCTRRSFIKSSRDTVLRILRAYYEGVQETRNDKHSALKILAKYVRVDDPEILAEVYRSYGQNHLQKSIGVDLEGVKGLLKGLGSEAAGANPSSFVDASLVQELEKDLSFQQRNR